MKGEASEIRSYHGQPVIKPPVWTWEIPVYFFTGGVAGASAGLAYLSEVRGNDVLARRAWGAAIGAIGISPALLISDLGRPERFLNMLRMFKVTSPMSLGSWSLSASGATTSLAALSTFTGRVPRLGRAAKPAAAFFGLPLSTYTAALLANTAVPIWHEARWTLPFVFASGAAMSAGAVATIATPVEHAGPARRLALGAAVFEGLSSELMHRRLGPLGEPYRHGIAKRLELITGTGLALGSALVATRGRRSRAASVAGGALLAGAALSARINIFRAGRASAADPKFTVGPQRARADAGEHTAGAASRTASRVDGVPSASVGSQPTKDGRNVSNRPAGSDPATKRALSGRNVAGSGRQ